MHLMDLPQLFEYAAEYQRKQTSNNWHKMLLVKFAVFMVILVKMV